MVPKLTSEMLALLPALHFIQALNYNTPAELDAAFGAIYDRFLSKCVGMTSSKLKTMASIGVGNYINIMGGNTVSEMKKKYLHLQQTDVELNHPRMVEALKFYDQNNLHQLTLTTPGQVIAIKLLAKIFPSISLLACLQ